MPLRLILPWSMPPRLIGPSIGGILIALFGEGTCFLINALSYIAVLFSLVMMKLPRWERSSRHKESVMLQLKGRIFLRF